MRLVFALIALVLAGTANLIYWWGANRPQEVGLDWRGPVASVSFAPFRKGQSPLQQIYPSRDQIESDMMLLKGKTKGLRTYTSREGMDVVPMLARQHGFQVTHSAWLGGKADINAKEIAALIEAANRYPDVITRVIVGNEVLLRRDLPPAQLVALIKQVKAQVKQPVSYADVWAFYLKHPEVGQAVDFLTIHILPYWEDEPEGVADVGPHFEKIVKLMQKAFPGKPILIGEAGWPTAGRSRGPAVPSVVNGSRHSRILIDTANRNGFDYNVVEAFDQLWKSKLEGTVGANWGLFDEQRQWKFPLAGPVTETADWQIRFLGSSALGILFFLAFRKEIAALPLPRQAAFALYAQMLATFAAIAGIEAYRLSYYWYYDLWGGIKIALLAVLVWCLLRAAAQAVGGREPKFADAPRDLKGIFSEVGRFWPIWTMGLGGAEIADRRRLQRAEAMVLAFAFLALLLAGLLIFDGRYRDIPVATFLAPCFGILGLGALRMAYRGQALAPALAFGNLFGADGPDEGKRRWDLALGLLFLLAALGILGAEGHAIVGEDFAKMHPDFDQQWPLILKATVWNREADVFAGMLALMGVPFLANWLTGRNGIR